MCGRVKNKWGCGWLLQGHTLCLSSNLSLLRSQHKCGPTSHSLMLPSLICPLRMECLLNARLGWPFGGEKPASGQDCSVDDPLPLAIPQLPGLHGVRALPAGSGLPCAVLRGPLTNSRVGVESLGEVSSSHFTWFLWVLLVLTKKQSPALFSRNAKNFLAPLRRKWQKPPLPGSRRSQIVY